MSVNDGMGGEFGRLLRDAHERMNQVTLDAKPLEAGDTRPIVARKLTAYAPVSCCALTDSTGVDHCQHPAPTRAPWHRRLRWRLSARWAGLRMRFGSWVAGVDLEREGDDW